MADQNRNQDADQMGGGDGNFKAKPTDKEGMRGSGRSGGTGGSGSGSGSGRTGGSSGGRDGSGYAAGGADQTDSDEDLTAGDEGVDEISEDDDSSGSGGSRNR